MNSADYHNQTISIKWYIVFQGSMNIKRQIVHENANLISTKQHNNALIFIYCVLTFLLTQYDSWNNHKNLKGSDKFRNFLFLIDPNTLLELINTHKSLIWSLFNLLLINKWDFLKIVGTHFWTLILHVHFYLYNFVIKSDI